MQVYTDAHCHPTETSVNEENLSLLNLRMVSMSTNLVDVHKVADLADKFPKVIIPAFGLHPWFSYAVTYCNKEEIEAEGFATRHYQSILYPPPSEVEIVGWPCPISITEHLESLKNLLNSFPNAMVGEIGLDKSFKLKMCNKITKFKVNMSHQREVLHSQLMLAAEMNRSVSLHGVQSPQPLYEEVIKVTNSSEPKLRSICLHSYTGSGDFLKTHWCKLDVPVFVSFSEFISGRLSTEKFHSILNCISPDQILSESDYHEAYDFQYKLVLDIISRMAAAMDYSLPEMKGLIENNFNRFIGAQ